MKAISKATPTDLALMILTAIIWASAFIAIKVAVPETGPAWLAAIRVSLGALVLAPFAIARGMVFPKGTRLWLLVIAMATLNVVVPFYLISWAELTIDAGVTSLLMGTGPFLAMVGSHFFTSDDRINRDKIIAVLFGFSGVLLIVGMDAINQIGTGHTLAQLAAVGGSLCYVIAGLIIRRIDMPALPLAFLALLIGSAMLVPGALLTAGLPPMPSNKALYALMFLGLLPTGLAYILRFHLIRKVGYSTFAISINMIPVFGILLGVLILGETLRPQVAVALVLVMVGLWFARRGSGAQATRPEPTKVGTA